MRNTYIFAFFTVYFLSSCQPEAKKQKEIFPVSAQVDTFFTKDSLVNADEPVEVVADLANLPPPPPVDPNEVPPPPPSPFISAVDKLLFSSYEDSLFHPDLHDEGEPFVAVEQMPEFPGGISELGKYLIKNIRYPAQARNQNIGSKIYIEFIITKTGEVRNIKVTNKLYPSEEIDNQYRNLILNMPRWKPGMQNGKPVNVRYSLPINICLSTQ